jgi:hypothetical protein
MDSKGNERLAEIPLRNAKAELRRGETPVRKLNPTAGEVLDMARGIVRLEAKAMAADMGISHSLVLRGLKSVDHLSFHRLWDLSDEFWIELILAIAKQRLRQVDVSTAITIKRIA